MTGAGIGAFDSAEGNYGFKATADGKVILGNTSDDVIQVTGSLSVNGAATFNPAETDVDFIVSSTNDEALRIDSTGVVFNEDGHATNDFRIESDNYTHMLFVDSGNDKIGIGTSSPTHALHIANTGPSSLYLEADTDNVDEDDTSYIKFTQDGGNTGTVLGLCPNSASKDPEGAAYTDTLGSSFLIGTTTSTPIQFGTNDNVRMTIKQAGNVGIGITNPSHLLEVDGTAKAGYYVTAPTATDLGSGTSTTLTPSTSLHFLDADSVTLDSGKDYFEITLADGTTAGQHLQLAITNTPNNPVKIMGDTGGAKASATITFTGIPASGEALTVTDTDSNTYTVTYSDAESCGNIVVAGERAITAGVFGCTTAADGAGQLYAAFDTGVGNGWPFTIGSFDWGVDTEVTLTQNTAGTAGNNTISENLSNASATGFSGGTALVEGSINSTYGVELSNAGGMTQGAHFVWDATSEQWQIIAGTQLTS
jgi:hypothetical protein